MPDDTTRWTVSVSKETDMTVRSLLARRGMKKGDLSKFIEDAVKWRVLDQTIAEARSKFADLAPTELEAMIGRHESIEGRAPAEFRNNRRPAAAWRR